MNIQEEIAAIIEKITPLDEIEKQHKERVQEWIESGAVLFRISKPANPPMHLVSYFIPFDEEKEKILLVHHKKADLWLPPGGHVDPGEHPKVTASREMEEELFQPAVFHQDDPVFLTVTQTANDPNPHTDVSLWYLVEGNSQQDYSFDEREFHTIKWFDINHLPQSQIEPHLHRFMQKIQRVKS